MASLTKRLLGGCLVGGLLFLTGCGTIENQSAGGDGADPKAVVTARAEARWKALVAGELDSAYGYLSPSTRKVVTLNGYRGTLKPGLWRGAKVKSLTCTEELCTVVVGLTYDLRNIKGLEKELEESWIKDEGKWWFVEKK